MFPARCCLLTFAALWLWGCAPEQKTTLSIPAPMVVTPEPVTPAKAAPSAPVKDPIFGVPDGFKPVYKVVKEEDISSSVPRWQMRIVVPKGLSKSDLESDLRAATRDEYQKRKPNAVSVAAYMPKDDYFGMYTAGMVEFAPYGDWGRASETVPIDQYKVVVTLADHYAYKK